MKTGQEIRETFLQFFESKTHRVVPSAPIVVKNDPTLMFTNAGMNPFKDIFLGLKPATHTRVADTQKCLRVSGKHNDLEEVGHDTYHHTMFEMLGNWSFGDYYKKEAIEWAWELLTARYGLSPDRLYVTIFGGDASEGLESDQDAAGEWAKWIAPDRILPFGKKDNFWEMGDTGPCGPCSEIHVDLRPDAERAAVPGHTLVNASHPKVVEIWNLVFIQYNRKADGSLEELPAKHVDTGMGFERLCMALQGKEATYDTDLFDQLKAKMRELSGITYAEAPEKQQIALRVVMDHIRALVFTIGDGQLPSNTGAGYVIRRLLRRASRYAFSYLGIQQPFLYALVPVMAEVYASIFPEVRAQKDFITRIIEEEEKGFLKKLETGSEMFEQYLSEHPGKTALDGAFAFRLYDTFGFPIDLTELMAREKGLDVDMEAFSTHLEEQKQRSRKATETNTGDWVVVNEGEGLPRFFGYDTLSVKTVIRQYRTVKTAKASIFQVVLDGTPFYAESGGQAGDKGSITNGVETLTVIDTQKENDLIIHVVERLPADPSGEWTATVNAHLRTQTSSNHTATHLLHAALRTVLGTHVEQRGSLVNPDLLRFDFSHFAKVTDEELAAVEAMVNEKITEGIALDERRNVPIAEAKALGAMALFGEKYGDSVRVIVFDPAFSVELCGGTHVPNTRDIRLFKLVSEGSVAAGIRRVEALTGAGAHAFFETQTDTLQRIAEVLKNPSDVVKAVEDLTLRVKALEKEVQDFAAEKVQQLKAELIPTAKAVGGINLICARVALNSADDLKQLSFELKKITTHTLIVLGAVVKEKPLLSVIMSDDLAAGGKYHAGEIVKALAKEIRGGGGGQPFYATAGGSDASRLDEALSKAESLI